MLSDLNELPAIKLTDTDYLRFELDSMTPFGREVAERELRETPENKKKAVEELKILLQGKKWLFLTPSLEYTYMFVDEHNDDDFII